MQLLNTKQYNISIFSYSVVVLQYQPACGFEKCHTSDAISWPNAAKKINLKKFERLILHGFCF